jgi:hypothetical protein
MDENEKDPCPRQQLHPQMLSNYAFTLAWAQQMNSMAMMSTANPLVTMSPTMPCFPVMQPAPAAIPTMPVVYVLNNFFSHTGMAAQNASSELSNRPNVTSSNHQTQPPQSQSLSAELVQIQRQPTQSVFLADLPGKDRRNMLAMHEDFVRTMKQQQKDQEEKQREMELEEQEEMNRLDLEASIRKDSTIAAAAAVIDAARRRPKDSDSSDEDEEADETSSHKSKRRHSSPSNEASGSPSPLTASATSSLVTFNEPKVLRVNIYEKFVRHLENFLNEQDALGITHMLFYPLCGNDGSYLMADHKAWGRVPVVDTSLRPKKDRDLKDFLVENQTATAITTTKFRYELLHNQHFSNLTEIGNNMNRQLAILPDAVLMHSDTKVYRKLNGETISISPFTFFSTVLLKESDLQVHPAIRYYCSKKGITVPAESTSAGKIATSIDFVIEGYTVVHYDKDDRITKSDSHIIIPM